MSTATDALELLTEQHDEIIDLLSQVVDSDDPDERSVLFRVFADKLAAHTAVEERVLYPAVMSDDTRELLLEATEEHLAMKRILADLLGLDPEDDHWHAKLIVLQEEVRHHARDREEAKLFPIVREEIDEDQLVGIGYDLRARYEELMEHEPRMMVTAETQQAARIEMFG